MIHIVEVQVADSPDAWRAAGFTVDADGAARIGTVRFACTRTGTGTGVAGWTVRDVAAVTTIDGLATRVVTDELAAPADHANGATHCDHIVVATPDVDRTVAAFVALGDEPRRERRAGNGPRAMRQVFVRAGEVILEIVGPPEPAGAGPASFWGLAFTVRDLAAAAAVLGDGLGPVKDAVQPGRRIATLRHAHYGISVPIVLMSA